MDSGAIRAPCPLKPLQQLPQRCGGTGQADGACPSLAGLRGLPRYDCLVARNLQPSRRHCQLRKLPQRHYCLGQARAACHHGARLQHLPQLVELEGCDSRAKAAPLITEATGRGHRSAEVNLVGGPAAKPRFLGGVAAAFGWLAMTQALAAPMPAAGLSGGPMVRFIDTQELEDHADISIEFACSVRYVINVPASHGDSTKITLRLGPDCGPQLSPLLPELPVVGGGGQLVTGARVDSVIPGELTLELTWSRPLDFVMAPTASGIGLRVRLLNINRRKGTAFIDENSPPATYAVNLDASQVKFTRDAVEAAAAKLQTQAYVSETDIDEAHWYRLPVRPFTSRA